MTVNVLDFWGAMTSGINGKSYRMVSADGAVQTIADSEDEKTRREKDGWRVIAEFTEG